MPAKLHGERYATAADGTALVPPEIADFIANRLHLLDYEDTLLFYQRSVVHWSDNAKALLGCNDRFYLLTEICGRKDARHPWLFDRCREVEAEPDGFLDLWARYHYKSTIGTFAGTIQEIIRDPEVTIAIMSCTNQVAIPFLSQLMQEFESNETLKTLYPDVFYQKPRQEAPRWSKDDGIVVKRRSNPKEATVEAFGVIDGMRTGKHYRILNYDDLVTEKLVTNPDMIKKVTERYELSDNLGSATGTRKWHWGTRYCTIGSSRILMGDWSHKPISDVQIGDTVVGWELRDGKRWLRPAKVINRGVHFAQPVNTYTLDNGRSVTCTEDHKWWRGAHGGGPEYAPLGFPAGKRRGRKPLGRYARGKLVALRELLVPRDASSDRNAAWLAGFFDGEGTVKKNKHHPSGMACITQTMHNPELIEETRRVLAALKFEWSESWFSPSKAPTSRPSDNQAEWADRCVFGINGGWRERYRFLAEVSPVRREKLAQTLFGQLTTNKRKLVTIEPAGFQDVHWLETETGNYVVEGFCSSNSFADSYGVLLERKTLKERRYPATEDGTLDGPLVFLSEKRWKEILNTQRTTVSAQMLQNPLAGKEQLFRVEWFKSYEIRPTILNVYIMVDPSKGGTVRSDRTAMAVIGVDVAGNRYLLDGVRHRMQLTERWENLKRLYEKWSREIGVQICIVGYERYGAQTEDEVIKLWQERDGLSFELKELSWPREGGHSKKDRVGRLEPDIRQGRFYMPALVYHPHIKDAHGAAGRDGVCWWNVAAEKDGSGNPIKGSERVVYRPYTAPSRSQEQCLNTGQGYRVVKPIRARDEDGNIYDVTRALMEELTLFPLAPKDDLVDAASRLYDMEPRPPTPFEQEAADIPAYAG